MSTSPSTNPSLLLLAAVSALLIGGPLASPARADTGESDEREQQAESQETDQRSVKVETEVDDESEPDGDDGDGESAESDASGDEVALMAEPGDDQDTSIAETEELEPPELEEPSPPIFPWVGEELYYSVLLRDSEAMRAGVRAGEVRRHGQRFYVPVSGMVRSQGWFNALYPVDDQANTFMDPESSYPLRTEKTFDENDRFRSYDVDYQHDEFTAHVERHRQTRQSHFEAPIPGDVHDMMTWLYDLRRAGNISIGDEFSYYVYDGWLHSRVDLEVVEREDLLTPIGWFKTWRLTFARHILNTDAVDDENNPTPQPPEISVREEARHTGSLWLSRDVNLLPVRVTVDTMWGSGEAVIIRYVPGKAQ